MRLTMTREINRMFLALICLSFLPQHPAEAKSKMFTITISALKKNYSPNEPKTIDVVITNKSRRAFTIVVPMIGECAGEAFDIEILDIESKKVARVRSMMDTEKKMAKVIYLKTCTSGLITLEPGMRHHEIVDLSKLYEIRELGPYTIKASLSLPQIHDESVSNTIRMMVVK